MEEILKKIENYLNTTPIEVLEKEWEEKEFLNEIGPDVTDYVQHIYADTNILNGQNPQIVFNQLNELIPSDSLFYKVA